jgi:hypothetical protein
MSDTWDGVPENPERDGAHWIIGWGGTLFVAEWQADPNAEFGGDWGWYDGGDRPDGMVANEWEYGGPCLLPSDHAALLAERDALRADVTRLRRSWLATIQAENSCPVTGGGCLSKRCGCIEEMELLMREDDALPLPGDEA